MPKIKSTNITKHNLYKKKNITICNKSIPKIFIFEYIDKLLGSLKPINVNSSVSVKAAHYKRITASSIYRVLHYPKAKSTQSKLSWFTLKSKHVNFGRLFEKSLSSFLSLRFINFYSNQTLITHGNYSWLGSTPDAMIKIIDCRVCQHILKDLGDIIYSHRASGLLNNYTASLQQYLNIMKNMCYSERIIVEVKVIGRYQWTRNFTLSRDLRADSEVYYQLQYGMYIHNCKSSFLICKIKGIKKLDVKLVKFDFEFVQNSIIKIQEFYITRRLPYLVNKKYTSHIENITKKPICLASTLKNKVGTHKISKKKVRNVLKIISSDDAKLIHEYVIEKFAHLFVNSIVHRNHQCFTAFKNHCHYDLRNQANALIDRFKELNCKGYNDNNAFLQDLTTVCFSKLTIQSSISDYVTKLDTRNS